MLRRSKSVNEIINNPIKKFVVIIFGGGTTIGPAEREKSLIPTVAGAFGTGLRGNSRPGNGVWGLLLRVRLLLSS